MDTGVGYQPDNWQVALDVLFVVFLLVKLSIWVLSSSSGGPSVTASYPAGDPTQNPFPDWKDLKWDDRLMVFLLFLVFFTHYVGYISYLQDI